MDTVLKDFIKQQLYDELSNAEIIPYDGSVWFIDRENTYWYFELTKPGKLWWRYDYFTNLFKVFNMDDSQFVPLLIEWVEEVLNSKVATASRWSQYSKAPVEEVLNSKVSATIWQQHPMIAVVEEVLNHKVITTITDDSPDTVQVEEVLNHKVSTTGWNKVFEFFEVERVLNHKVDTTISSQSPKPISVGNVLNNEQ